MADGVEEVRQILQLAVEQGLLTQAGMDGLLLSFGVLPPEERNVERLVREGVLSADKLVELQAALEVAGAPTLDPHEAPTVPSSAATERFPEIPGYQVIRELGHGGMGVVYEAEQERPQRRVAVKVMRSGGLATDAQRRRFEREAQAAADLNHPGVVTIHEFGEVDGQPYFSMELVEGERLNRYVADRELSVREKLELMQRACEAVAYAHQRGVIHRDLKPSNVVVQEDGQPKVLDFGLAKLTELPRGNALHTLTMDGQVLGTVPYMAPEQTLGREGEVDVRTDVYALGVILYEVLVGQLPYDLADADVVEAMRRVREQEPTRPSTVARLIGDEVETILLMALAKEKERRYQSAEALAADVGRYLAGEAIEAKRASAVYQLRKLAQRHRAVLAPASLALLAIVAVALGAFLKVRSERDLALVAKRDAQAAQAEEARQRREAVAAREEEARQRGAAVAAKEEADRAREAEATQRELAEAERDRAQWESYVRLIALADSRIRESAWDQARELLREAPAAYRHWEWGRLVGELLPAPLTLTGHTQGATSAAFSPDGRRIVTGSEDETARVWDAATGEELLVLTGHTGMVFSTAFSPDGRRIVTASADETARVWDAAAGEDLLVLTGHTDYVRSAAFSLDGGRIVTASQESDGTARVWDATTGEELLVLTGHTAWPDSAAFSPDGRRIVTASFDRTVRVWDAMDWTKSVEELERERFEALHGP